MLQRCFGCMREFEGENFCPYCGYKVGSKAQEAVHMVPGMLLHRRYTVGRVLGYGSFGVTYIAWDPILQQPVAVKEFMPSEFSTRIPGYSQVTVFEGDKAEQFRDGMRKFIEEARHLAKFGDEPGIVKIFDSFEENGTAYIIMEYLEGETLAARLEREGVIPEDEAVKMLRPVMESLSIVHQEGLLHRDIAPDNIFLTKSGEVKLIDFGASRYATTSHSRSLTVIIKPGYSPEEQYRSRGDQGPYTDVYAVAATLYRMITGVVPPDALERRAQYENANRDILKEPHKVKKGISLQRENAILNAMNVRIEDRTPDMETFMRELEADPPAKRIYGKIKKLDFYRLPLWLKIALPAVLGLVLLFGTLMLTGVISFKRTQREFYVPEGIVMVPEVEGLSSAEATALIKDGRLLPVLDGNVESEYITAGKIVLQTPAPGAFAPVNSSVKVIVSAGKGVIPPFNGIATVPYVILDSLEDARTKLQKAGLGEVSVEEIYDESVKEGLVISQDIASGTEVEEGRSIKLEVSKGPAPFALGNYVDQTYEEAKKTLEDLGLQVTVDYKNDNEKAEGTVLAQDIDPETQVRRGDSIVLTVSSGKETLTVEDVVGQAEADAKKRLETQGFEVNILENFDKEVSKGLVISQTPAGGSSQLYGSQITIIVSKGKQPIKVSFDTDGGEAISEVLTVYEGEAYGALPTPSRDGYTFEGWYLSAEGEERITEDSLVQGSSDHNLVARWEVIETTEAPTEPPTTVYVPPTTPYVPPTTPAPTQPPVSLSGISVRSNPTKTSYFVGETLDTAGLKLTAKYNDGSSKEISSGFTCSPTQLSTAGSQTITVTYGGKSASFTVNVNAVTLDSISVKNNPNKTSYFVGETLDTTGLKLTAKYSDGSSKEISSGFTCSPTQLSTAGSQTITVTYSGKSASFAVNVNAVTLDSISIKSNPSKTSYFVGESLDTAGLKLTAKYSDGSSKEIGSGFTCTPTQLSTAGSQTITVTYGDKSASFTVNVNAVTLDSISVKSNPTKTSYFVGDSLNTDGLTLVANYNNGTSSIIGSGFSCSPTQLNESGTQTITVSYEGKTASFSVQVTAVTVDGISVISKPSKTSYYVGDNLNTSGLMLRVYYNNGTSKDIGSGFDCNPTQLGSAGTKDITVSYGGKTSSFSVTVNTPSIKLNYSNYSLAPGHTLTITATTQPGGQSVQWSSDNSSAVSVSGGKVKALTYGKSANITASFNYGGKNYSAKAVISIPTPSFSLSSTSGSFTTDVQENAYIVGGSYAFPICSVPSVNMNWSSLGNGGDTATDGSKISVEWNRSACKISSGKFYGLDAGTYTQEAKVYYNGIYLGSRNFTTTLNLTMTASSIGNYIRSDHYKSASQVGFIGAGRSGIEVYSIWLSGTPGVSGTEIWGNVYYNYAGGWSLIAYWE